MGVFPEAGVAGRPRANPPTRAAAIGSRKPAPIEGPLLAGEPAVAVRRWLIGPELLGWYAFHGWARLVRAPRQDRRTARAVGVWGFALFLWR
jgi:hypothetical protein